MCVLWFLYLSTLPRTPLLTPPTHPRGFFLWCPVLCLYRDYRLYFVGRDFGAGLGFVCVCVVYADGPYRARGFPSRFIAGVPCLP